MKSSFKHSLEKEILKRSMWLALFTYGLLTILLLIFSFLTQNHELIQDSHTLIHQIRLTLSENEKLLLNLNQNILPGFVEGKRTTREVYSSFYQGRAQAGIHSELMIYDSEGHTLLSTLPALDGTILSQHYLKIVAKHSKEKQVAIKVVNSSSQQRYLLFFCPIVIEGSRKGESVLVIRENDFLSHQDILSIKYILTDRFGNIFTRNSDFFTHSSLQKVDESLIKEQSVFNAKNPLITYQHSVGNDLNIYTFRSFFSLATLFLFSLGLTVTMLGFHIWQVKILSHRVAERNTVPIESLVNQMKRISKGQANELVLQTQDEFEFMAQHINKMLRELEELHEQNLQLESEKLIFERKMLEAQFNPHFLYNTLETIKITSYLDSQLTDQLIQNLTSILRYSVQQLDKETSMGEDLAILSSYLNIHKIRFENFSYELHCSKELEKIAVPRLFLLPLVENAIKYGMKYRIDLHISIEIIEKENNMYFTVWDNAGGLSRKDIAEILKSVKGNQTQHGLVNSYKRVKEFFKAAKLDLGVNRSGHTWVCFIVEKNQEKN